MNIVQSWLDRSVERLCKWLNDFLSGGHGLATAGEKLAGLEQNFLLPVDRRSQDSKPLLIHNNIVEKLKAAAAKGGSANPAECGFWAYCHMNGQPCVWCSGINSLTAAIEKDFAKLCPAGKMVGTAWYGCCKDPGGKLKMIAFADCCGSGTCKFRLPCKNWPEAKNWCTGIPAAKQPKGGEVVYVDNSKNYYCTVAVDVDPDPGDSASCA